jgi:aspartate/methionine/tyrosine aminotransferase
MNPLAKELNQQIADVNPHVLDMLSDLGKSLYFPKGILSQSAEAKKLATRFNATIGTALEDGVAMNLPVVMEHIEGISPNDALLYAPSPGTDDLRQAWLKKIQTDNPSLKGVPMSLPVVTSGLTHGLSLVADMFIDDGDVLLLPDKIWGNYRLIFEVRRHADIRQYTFFEKGGFNIDAFREALHAVCKERDKVVVLLNFPRPKAPPLPKL